MWYPWIMYSNFYNNFTAAFTYSSINALVGLQILVSTHENKVVVHFNMRETERMFEI